MVRKRDLLAHPVEAMREGRVRRGADQVFGSEEEEEEERAGGGSFRRERERKRVSKRVSSSLFWRVVFGEGEGRVDEERSSEKRKLTLVSFRRVLILLVWGSRSLPTSTSKLELINARRRRSQ